MDAMQKAMIKAIIPKQVKIWLSISVLETRVKLIMKMESMLDR